MMDNRAAIERYVAKYDSSKFRAMTKAVKKLVTAITDSARKDIKYIFLEVFGNVILQTITH